MPLKDDIQALRDRTIAELVEAHDYYHESKRVWEFAAASVVNGQQINADNPVTGTKTPPAALRIKAERYVAEQLAEATFQQFLAIFEAFVFDLIRLWLTAYPRRLGKKSVEYRTILDLPDKAAITDLIVTRELVEVAY